MKIIIFGGTGFIGTQFLQTDLCSKSEVILVTRSAGKKTTVPLQKLHVVVYGQSLQSQLQQYMSGEYCIINLAGESISKFPWSAKQKRKILQSRIQTTELISELVNQATEKPEVIIQGSATGYYDPLPEKELNESSPPGNTFLSGVTQQWENSLRIKEPEKTRIVVIRTGLVLGTNGGLLPRLLLPFRLFAGGHIGNGSYWMPWIHINDEVRAIGFLINNRQANGVYNLVSPNPIRMKTLMKEVGKQLGRPSWFHIPAFVLKLFLGQFAQELLLTSYKIVPDALNREGFEFRFPEIENALYDLIDRKHD